MIAVGEAIARIVAAFAPLPGVRVPIADAAGRVLAEEVVALMNQPPDPVSSMDGYALRAADAATPGARLKVVGAAPAGHPYHGILGPGEAVRIFTGGVVPEGADAILIQEDAEASGNQVVFQVAAQAGRHIRVAGLDFKAGEVLATAGQRLSARDLSLIAAGDVGHVKVRRKPRVAFAATGDELSVPGASRQPGGIVASSGYALAAMIERWGGSAIDLGIVPDTAQAVASIADRTTDADLIVTMGGASVGEHDLVQKALGPRGFELDFWKIAIRPGKPLIFGRLDKTPLLGLPGNPVSTLVCAMLFLKPAIAAMLGAPNDTEAATATLAGDLKANDGRQDYMRAKIELRNGERFALPFAVQDSSMMSILARADALIVRPPQAPAAKAGESVPILFLE
ncbi:MAG TPA: gephyrin-like molybdotransferase Glp [Rhizomicrobium sp.]